MKKTFVFLFFLLLIMPSGFARDSSEVKLVDYVKNINNFSQLLPQEKVYLHFDNTGYYLGETIWFKAYLFRSEENKPSEISKVLYVDFLNQDGFVVETKKLKVENGETHGEFLITDTLYSGFYEVRAYTAYMLNFDVGSIFSRVFPVYEQPEYEGDYASKIMREREKHNRITLKEQNSDKDFPVKVSFYPEGGNLVRGLKSKVAIKAVEDRGQNLKITGKIYKKGDRDAVADFQTLHAGTGYFDFIPDGEKYVAGITYNDVYREIPLPDESETGFVMTVNNMNSADVLLQIAANIQSGPDRLGLIVGCRGRIYEFYEINTRNGPVAMRIPKSKLPTGVNQITLMDENGVIHAERLIFVNHGDYQKTKLNVVADGSEYKPFSPIRLTFTAADEGGQPLQTGFSLAVRDAATEEETYNTDNLLTNLLLSSELKGFIENPDYYFKDNSAQRRHNLDLLLLTQGWRRYNISQMSGKEKFTFKYKPETEITVSGTVYTAPDRVKRRKLMPGSQVKIWALDDEITMDGTVVSDENGKFRFSMGDITGSFFLGMQANVLEEKGKNKGKWFRKPSNILVDRFIPPHPKPYDFYETEIPLPGYDALTNGTGEAGQIDGIPGMQGRQLEEVTVTTKRKKRKRIESFPPAVIIDVADEMDLLIDLYNWLPDACEFHNHDKEVIRAAFATIDESENPMDFSLDPILQIAIRDTNFVNPSEIQGMNGDQLYNYILRRNSNSKSPEIRAVTDAMRNLRRFSRKTGMEEDDDRGSSIAKRYAAEALTGAAGMVNLETPADPCVQSFAAVLRQRLGLLSLTKVDYVYDLPPTNINMFYLDYIDKIMIFTDKSIRDINFYEKPHESWVADIAVRYVPYEEKNYRRPHAEGIRATKLHGYSQTCEFYNPDYAGNKIPDEPDFRRTLYWNPDVKTDNDGKAVVNFYNNSICKQITVSAEGLTAEGLPVVTKTIVK